VTPKVGGTKGAALFCNKLFCMIKFSSEQLLVLQSALAPPLPPLAPPPGMGRPSPPPAAASAPLLLPPDAHASGGTPSSSRVTSLPLSALTPAYLCVAGTVALASIAAPDRAAEGALVASPLLALALGVHSLALLPSSPPASFLGVSCALSTPALLRLAPPPRWGPWLCCASTSAFFAASTPRGLLRVLALFFLVAVLAAAAAALSLSADHHQRAAWGAALVALSIQSAISTGRLRAQRLKFRVWAGAAATEANG